MASDLLPEWNEFEWMGDLSRETGAPVTFTALESPIKSLPFKDQLGDMRAQNAKGGNIVAQISMRGTGLILGGAPLSSVFAAAELEGDRRQTLA